jgi:hypothetical protein
MNGTPSHDHLGDILPPRAFQLCLVAWVAALTCTPAVVIAIDGKTSRRSYQTKGSKEAVHMVSLRSEATHRAGPGQGEREIERPALLEHDVDRRARW